MHLLPLKDLIQTGPLDHADWNYRGIIGWVSKKRFELVASLLPTGAPVPRLLEIGYGSGLFMPELALYTKKLYGIDIHNKNTEVAEVLHQHGVEAELLQGDAAALPFTSNSFDIVVSVSALEFVQDLPKAISEIKRVLRHEGVFIMVVPGSSPLLDAALWLTTGESAKKDYGDSRQQVLPELQKAFVIEAKKSFPPFMPVYNAYRMKKNTAIISPVLSSQDFLAVPQSRQVPSAARY